MEEGGISVAGTVVIVLLALIVSIAILCFALEYAPQYGWGSSQPEPKDPKEQYKLVKMTKDHIEVELPASAARVSLQPIGYT